MRFAHFFVDRPIFASVLSIVLLIVGSIAYFQLPVAQYPEIAPPTIVVRAAYPGADAETIANTVATPLEQEINGVENMLYMSSYSTADGSMALTITFKLGTDLDQAQVLVQNRVSIAEPRLPEDVRRIGITTAKSSPDLMMVVHLLSPNERYDQLYVSNYARTRIRDLLVRLDGVGDVILFGEREYALRVWLDPEKLSAYGMTAGDVVQALREQNVQVSGGSIGAPPTPGDSAFQYTVTTDGRFSDARQFRYVIVKATESGRLVQLQDVARIELGAQRIRQQQLSGRQPGRGAGHLLAAGYQRARRGRRDPEGDDGRFEGLSGGPRIPDRLQPDRVHLRIDQRGLQDDRRSRHSGGARGSHLPAILAHSDHPDRGDPGVAGRHLRVPLRLRLLAQHADIVRPGAGDRHRRRRCHRRGRERRTKPGARHDPARGVARDRWTKWGQRSSRSRWC